MKLTQPIKISGGKHYLAPKIIDLMVPHVHFVEPFFGGGSVLLQRDPMDPRFFVLPHKGVSEVVNDIDHHLVNFWRFLKSETSFQEFKRAVEATPFSRTSWKESLDYQGYNGGLLAAVQFFICARQSRSGGMKGFTPLTRSRTRRGMNGNVSEWLGAIEGLSDVHERLKRVVIECMPAIDLIKREDTENTLFYCDPPYLHETRASKDLYRHEMTENDHKDLLEVLLGCKGKVMVSGYRSMLYDGILDMARWRHVDFSLPNHMSSGKSKDREVESLWMNWS